MSDPAGWKFRTEQNDLELANSSSCQKMEFVVKRALFKSVLDVIKKSGQFRHEIRWPRASFRKPLTG
jgi:hypothetical protein